MEEESDIERFHRMQQSYLGNQEKAVSSVYVKNLDASVSNSDIAAHFRSCGNISGINVISTKNSKKYAIIDFSSEKSVEMSLLFNGSVLKGKKIIVQRKRDR
ncbi:RNA-binding protein [Encephalitozoon intestinalis ATCC 50506]|uniref:RNA-binding protein n=1 Tax=Encephalitozoon intestinalis (strain ATCC 50506) TaxID=876142 RepID=E0S5B9_ENCIT|nr:RNA-binding protein [Encephalitozoon intestinalis ATCC 50506]ADM10904.1 RNA-binding protein [Encephalitozoon intestinalis ATCC 50506]UTX44537.1 RNA-binding protein [Encephalitozoon intestinalis]